MRHTPNLKAEAMRIAGPVNTNYGMFALKRNGTVLKIVVSEGQGWDHVSVSLRERDPTWEEMEHVKQLFLKDDEWAVQYHPAKSNYINQHPHCLHIWRPQSAEEIERIKQEWIASGEALPEPFLVNGVPGLIPIPPDVFV